MHTIIINVAIYLNVESPLKSQQFDANTMGGRKIGMFDDATIRGMEVYFHVQDREILLKYLKDTMLSDPRG